ncbi:reverse transcriptase domain-containing protein [Tanacetum coccineum]
MRRCRTSRNAGMRKWGISRGFWRVGGTTTGGSKTEGKKLITKGNIGYRTPAPATSPSSNDRNAKEGEFGQSGKLNHLVKDVRQRGGNRGKQTGGGSTNGKVINMVYEKSDIRRRKFQKKMEEDWMNAPIAFPPIPFGQGCETKRGCRRLSGPESVRGSRRNGAGDVRALLPQPVSDHSSPFNANSHGIGGVLWRTIIANRKNRIGSYVRKRRSEPKNYDEVYGNTSVIPIQHNLGTNKDERAPCRLLHHSCNDKVSHPRGIATLVPRRDSIFECRQLEDKQILLEQPKEETVENKVSPTEEDVMINPTFPDQKVTIGTQFPSVCRLQLINLLKNNKDEFAWQPTDMVRVPRRISQHTLNVNPSITLIAQKRMVLGPEKSRGGYEISRGIDQGKNSEAGMIPNMDIQPRASKEGRNLEAYVDDMVIEIKTERDMIMNVAETFDNLKKTEEAEQAFQELKKLIMKLPMLTTPSLKETLYLYLADSKEAASGVLMTGREGKQTPIRYVSRTFHEAERNYAPLEKLALCLLHLSRRLRRYFEAHPIKQILNKPEVSRKLAKYAVELGAYNITYIPQNVVKGQVLADFLNEVLIGTKPLDLKGAGVGLVLIDPASTEYTYAIRLNFTSTKSEAEYEALLVGLPIAGKMKVRAFKVKMDSKLVAYQLNGEFMSNSHGVAKYLAKEKELSAHFKKFSIENIPRNQNQKADAREINAIMEEEEDNWMTPIVKCLEEGIWPKDENEARALRMKISQYVMEAGILFKKSYMSPMLRCVGLLQAKYIIREVHERVCGMHSGARSVVAKIMRQGYYWPSMHRDTKEVMDRCDSCQIHGPVPRLPKTKLTSIMSPWPFYQWGLDILRPIPEA